MLNKTILIIEDDSSISNFLQLSLKVNNYNIIETNSGLTGISMVMTHSPDLIVLDLGLPDVDGLEVLKQIRQSSLAPVVIVSARSQEKEKVLALDLGADDYVTKPFGVDELLARIRVCLRKHAKTTKSNQFIFDTMKIDFGKRKVFVEDKEIHLTPIEYKMLLLFAENSGKVLTHKFIQQKIWGYDSTDEYQSLRVFMANIRKKIELDTTHPRFIKTEVGVGYRFSDE